MMENEKKPIGFDPMTGKPIYEETAKAEENAKQPTGFDPMTGEPIYEETAKAEENAGQPTGFDPMTGEPIYGNTAKATDKKPFYKRKAVMIPAVVVVAGVVVFTGVKNGAFLGKSGKVAMATLNTLTDNSHITKNLAGLSLLESDDYTITWSGSFGDEFSGDLTFSNGSKQKQLSGNVDVDSISDIEFVGNLTSDELQLQVPGFSDELFVYNYTEDKDGYITELADDDDIEAFDKALQTVFSSKEQKKEGTEGAKILKDFYKGLEFKSVGKEEFEVDGKDRKCKGFQTTITGDDLADLTEQLQDFAEENYGDSLDDLGADLDDSFDDIYEELDEFPDTDVTFYIYKGKLACVQVEIGKEDAQLVFHGGKTRTQNMELLVNDDTIMEMEGETNGSKEQYELSLGGISVGELEYDYKSGDYSIDINSGYDDVTIEGTLKGSKKSFEFGISSIEAYDLDEDIDFNVSLKKGAKFQKVSGDKFDIGNASEDDLEDLMYDLEDYFE